MSTQDLVSGQLRLVKVNPSRISELRPGNPVFVLSALSRERKILGQFHNVKAVQADAVGKRSKIGRRGCQSCYDVLNSRAGVAFAPGFAPASGRPGSFRRQVWIGLFATESHITRCVLRCCSTGCTKFALFHLDNSHMPASMALATCCADATTGEAISIYSKVLHHQDPTQLLLKELNGNVVRSGDGCILLGEYSVYEENIKLEQQRDGTPDRLPYFWCDLFVSTSGLSPLTSPPKHAMCDIFSFSRSQCCNASYSVEQAKLEWEPTCRQRLPNLILACENKTLQNRFHGAKAASAPAEIRNMTRQEQAFTQLAQTRSKHETLR